MNKLLHISSATNGTISIGDDKLYIGDKSVHLMCDGNVYVTFTPASDTNNQILINLPSESNESVDVIPYHNNHFDIHINCKGKYNNIVYQKHFGKIDIQIYSAGVEYCIQIYLENDLKLSLYTPAFTNITAITNSFIIIYGNINNCTYAVVIDENFKMLLNNKCVEFELEEDRLRVLIDLNDIPRHGRVYDFDLKNNTFDKYLVYLDNIPAKPTDVRLIPLAMLQCLIAGAFASAATYMLNQTNPNKLQSYFGNITKAYYNPYDNSNINYTVVGDTIKSYNFTIENNKIKDIDEVVLKI